MKKILFLLLAFPLCALSAPQYTWESQGASYTGQIDLGSSSTDGLSGSLSPSYSGINGNNAVQPPVVIVSGAASGGGGSSTGITYTSETCFTSDNLSWTPPAGTTYIEALVVGGGGGGGWGGAGIPNKWSAGISGALRLHKIQYSGGQVAIRVGKGGEKVKVSSNTYWNGSAYQTDYTCQTPVGLGGIGATNGSNGYCLNNSASQYVATGGGGGSSAVLYPAIASCPGAGCYGASGGSSVFNNGSAGNVTSGGALDGATCDGYGAYYTNINDPSLFTQMPYSDNVKFSQGPTRNGVCQNINRSYTGGNLPSMQLIVYSGNFVRYLIDNDPGRGYFFQGQYTSLIERDFYRYDKPIPEPKNCGLTAPAYGWGGGGTTMAQLLSMDLMALSS